MYVRRGVGQYWDFACVNVTTRDPDPTAIPLCYITIDNSAQYEAPGPIDNLGGGAFRLHLAPDDTDGRFVHIFAVAPGMFPRDVMILPFDGQQSLSGGGTGSDLSATGPGVLVQAATGANVTVVAPGTSGNVLTSAGGVWASAAPAAAAVAIGSVVTGGTPGDILTVGAGPVLAQTTYIPLDHGGTGGDLSTSGPGVLVQSALGATVSEVTPGADGNVLTAAGGVWTSAAPAAAGVTGTGTAGDVTFWTGTGTVSSDNNFTWDAIVFGLFVSAANSSYAGVFTNDSGQVELFLCPFTSPGLGSCLSATNGNASNLAAIICNTDPGSGPTAAFYGINGTDTAVVCTGTGFALDAANGAIRAYGITNNTFTYQVDATAPATHAIGSLPLAFYGPPAPAAVLATPNKWILFTIGSTDYKIPCYL